MFHHLFSTNRPPAKVFCMSRHSVTERQIPTGDGDSANFPRIPTTGQIKWMIFIRPTPPQHCPLYNTVAVRLKQRSPDRSITNLHSQQSVTDSMPTKPLAIHYREPVQGKACPTAAC